ncbi:flagellar hook-length control protein FliK [Rhizobacter sp. AJA081-3]|uniref:flagellar hook-length control protein FliK n=1 Tax=Rhizobacter sp. AJA081-3 TaxID=2753607 RepID=UPI001ADECA38|nr:flagellar hook-length control protein FliK [Rhizobacter sp. AJA081-3]QTN24043.1 flagellar hook-length control protein FliK [Rhizobacter sp. AJA081-3]
MQIQPPFALQPSALPQTAESAGTPGAPGGGFAQLMANTRSERESVQSRDAAADHDSADAVEGEDAAEPSTRPDEGRAARLRHAGRTPQAPHAEARPAAKPPEPADETARTPDAPATVKDAAAMDPALAQWLAQLHLPPADAAAPKIASNDSPVSPGDDAVPTPSGGRAAEVPTADNSLPGTRPGDRTGAGLAERTGRESPAVALQAAAQAAEESKAASAPAERETAAVAAPQGFSLPAGFEPAQAAAALRAEAASPTVAEAAAAVAVPVPLDSPDFAQAFGVQVSVLARDGVHEARLHLNPAEMGPVSVQIAMDGERAHIDFGAQAAATRAAIEASLPELAAALRDAGLTLSGGGVSQHTPGRGDAGRDGPPDGAASTTREREASATGTTSRPAWRGRVTAGGVDLYA